MPHLLERGIESGCLSVERGKGSAWFVSASQGAKTIKGTSDSSPDSESSPDVDGFCSFRGGVLVSGLLTTR